VLVEGDGAHGRVEERRAPVLGLVKAQLGLIRAEEMDRAVASADGCPALAGVDRIQRSQAAEGAHQSRVPGNKAIGRVRVPHTHLRPAGLPETAVRAEAQAAVQMGRSLLGRGWRAAAFDHPGAVLKMDTPSRDPGQKLAPRLEANGWPVR